MNRKQRWLNQTILHYHLKKERNRILRNERYEELLGDYSLRQREILDLYQQAYYWHGTGLYQYQVRETKYDGIDYDGKRNILAEIFDYGGLKPHFDQWIEVDGGYSSSISVTKLRTYARFYAELHNTDKKDLVFSYGDREFLIRYYVFYTIAQINPIRFIELMRAAFTDDFMKSKGSVWANTVNSQLESKNNAVSDLINILGSVNSDIPDNFGVLIGIKKNAFRPAKISPEFALSEARSLTPIRLEDFTHLEVPYDCVSRMKELLNKRDIELPVIPIELGEIFKSRLSAVELMSELD